ncbi:MAG: hypothetical protein AAB465_00640 [Patescibacteria group bacterium]
MAYLHQNLASGRWQTLSLAEQMGNIGSEVGRAANWQKKDKKLFEGAVSRALELLDLTISDGRWRKRLKELTRVRELLGDAFFGGREYGTTWEDLDKYFLNFALLSRKNF